MGIKFYFIVTAKSNLKTELRMMRASQCGIFSAKTLLLLYIGMKESKGVLLGDVPYLFYS